MDIDSENEEMETYESDDNLEDIPDVIKKAYDGADSFNTSLSFDIAWPQEREKCNRLDDLLTELKIEQVKSETLNKVKEELWIGLFQNCKEECNTNEDSHTLASEHADHIDQLEVKGSKLCDQHPGLTVFRADQFCCLFTDRVTPSNFGFYPSESVIDKSLANIRSDKYFSFLDSNILLFTSILRISCLDKVMLWLMNLMSIHSIPRVVEACHRNLNGIIQQLAVHNMSVEGREQRNWCPNPLDLLQIFVNLGATKEELLGSQSSYTSDDIKKALYVMEDATKEKSKETPSHLSVYNFGKVLQVLNALLQTSPEKKKEDLSLMMYMLVKISLDKTTGNCISHEMSLVLTSLLECYSKSDWPLVVPDICKRLQDVTDDHHNQAFFVNLFRTTSRSSYLKKRLSYIFLRKLLVPNDDSFQLTDLENLKFTDIVWFGGAPNKDASSPLTKALKELGKVDLYKLSSALKLLDMCIGDESARTQMMVSQLEYLIQQLKLVIKETKDRINEPDVFKVKDAMTIMVSQWSLSLQHTKVQQRSIFTWASASTHLSVEAEVLEDKKTLDWEDTD
ncbi:unnamed protein product [Lymnaea stagnalis]|uniref:VHS domain-containing protein n=1 Tax=Lymnaea stagnalis TaxID=6523 RepID=A0AAV2GXG6_LYMST